jgi:hypothetical protein
MLGDRDVSVVDRAALRLPVGGGDHLTPPAAPYPDLRTHDLDRPGVQVGLVQVELAPRILLIAPTTGLQAA